MATELMDATVGGGWSAVWRATTPGGIEYRPGDAPEVVCEDEDEDFDDDDVFGNDDFEEDEDYEDDEDFLDDEDEAVEGDEEFDDDDGDDEL
ncbi:MAG: hypothetical protein IT436_00615 [Phycisphaerales bacterium]|nr:hypothetical protein [Phycisphaerales bacterium]